MQSVQFSSVHAFFGLITHRERKLLTEVGDCQVIIERDDMNVFVSLCLPSEVSAPSKSTRRR